MKCATLAAALILVIALPAAADLETYMVDPQHTFPAYEIGHFGYSLQRGRFDRTSGKITLDMDARKGSADIAIDTASASSGVPKLDEHLRAEDFFNSARFPQMTFKSTGFTFEGDKVTSAGGDLTILGVTRPVTFKVTHFHCGVNPMVRKKICGADMTATIRRSDFGMRAYLPALADDVLLRVNIEAIKDS